MSDEQFNQRLAILSTFLVKSDELAREIESDLEPFKRQAQRMHDIRGFIAKAGEALFLATEGL